MPNPKAPLGPPILRWTLFLLLLVVTAGWAFRTVLARAQQMKTAETQASAWAAMAPGTVTKAVVRIDEVRGTTLRATTLERRSDTVYLRSSALSSCVTAILSPETSLAMGEAEDIVPGAIVQLAGTLDDRHVLRTAQVVILTGYIHLEKESR